jgi:hypothetical protein
VARISEASDGTDSLEIAGDLSSVRIGSAPLAQCTEAEIATISAMILNQYAHANGEAMAAMYVQTATQEASINCNQGKRIDFDDSVGHAQSAVAGFLIAIEAPDRVSSELDGLRGVDGTHETTAPTAAGLVTVQARYDGSNGLDVVFSRETSTVDWNAPLRALGL